MLSKPPGLAVQAGSGLRFSLVDIMAELVPDALPVHRLDRGTSGLLVMARGRRAAAALQQAFRSNQVEKRYLALLDGHLPTERVVVTEPLKKIRDASGQARVIVAHDGDPAHSEFNLLERLPAHDFVEVAITTGRTHQIRAHALALGLPLAGDDRYNAAPSLPGLKRPFLHAHYLRLPWPEDQVFDAPLPEDLCAALEWARRQPPAPIQSRAT